MQDEPRVPPDIAADLAAEGYALAPPRRTVAYDLPADLADWIADRARADGMSASDEAQHLLELARAALRAHAARAAALAPPHQGRDLL